MTPLQRGMLMGIVAGLVAVVGLSNHWPGIVIIGLEILAAVGVSALMRERPERPL